MIGRQFKIKPETLTAPDYPPDYPRDPERVFTVLHYDPDISYEVEAATGDEIIKTALFKEEEIIWVTPDDTTEWGVLWPSGNVTTHDGNNTPMTEPVARSWVAGSPEARVVRREVTKWTEVPR